ncbi:YbaB/EbfC family nucleoid-associated protein, partial [Mycolicibacterium fortuitum]
DIDRYNRDKAYVQSVHSRLERAWNKLEEWKRACSDVSLTAQSPDGEVTLTVNDHGTITFIELAEGATQRHTNLTLERLINETLLIAQGAANEEVAELDGEIGPGDFLAAFDEGLAESELKDAR